MFPIKCPRCSVVGYANVTCNCFHNANDTETKNPIEGSFQPTHEEDVPRCTSEAIGSHNLDPIEIKTGSGDLVSNKKRKESQDEVRENIPNLKKYCQDVSEIRNENQDFLCDPTGRNKETRNTEYISVSEKNHFMGVQEKLRYLTESQLNNRGMQEHGKLCEKIPLPSDQNIKMKISIRENDIARCENLDSVVSNVENKHSTGHIAIPGPSGLLGSENASNLFGEKSQSRENEAKMCRTRKTFTCRVCKKEIHEHIKIFKGKTSFSCCVCSYFINKTSDLYLHVYMHCAKKTCKLCEKEYAEADWHKSEDKCKVCQEVFECTTSLDHHSLNHTEYYSSHCWGCSEKLRIHFNTNYFNTQKDPYDCCVCGFRTVCYETFRNHNSTHRPNMFCKKCREEYPIEEKSLHDTGHTCIVCKNELPCQTLLEDHYIKYHEGCFNTYCLVCKGELYDHRKVYKENNIYKCCQCPKSYSTRSELQSHFHCHSSLKLYKCEVCGKRFVFRNCLTKHSKTCKEMLYECEICRAKFPSSGCLETHSFEKHS